MTSREPTVEERLANILKLHAPKTVRLGMEFYPRKPLEEYETRTVCAGCEVNWWPCLTYRVATGEIVDWEVPA